MAELTDGMKEFVVTRLACFLTPDEIVAAAKEELGDSGLRREDVLRYQRATRTGKQLGVRLLKLFEEKREQFLMDLERIPIANRAYRLKKLQALLDRNEENAALVTSLLDRAAKEMSGPSAARKGGAAAGGMGPGISFEDALKELRKQQEADGRDVDEGGGGAGAEEVRGEL